MIICLFSDWVAYLPMKIGHITIFKNALVKKEKERMKEHIYIERETDREDVVSFVVILSHRIESKGILSTVKSSHRHTRAHMVSVYHYTALYTAKSYQTVSDLNFQV